MSGDARGEVTQLLDQWAKGDQSALEAIAAVVSGELHKIADGYLRRERAGHTLQPTALVNEAWLRLVRQDPQSIQNRKHFFALAAHIMRQVLVAHARTAKAHKRGGGTPNAALEDGMAATPAGLEDFLILDDALTQLAANRPRAAEILELRYFGGLSVQEVGELLGISIATVSREQKFAEARLNQLMSER